jgi:hypothetical protein
MFSPFPLERSGGGADLRLRIIANYAVGFNNIDRACNPNVKMSGFLGVIYPNLVGFMGEGI